MSSKILIVETRFMAHSADIIKCIAKIELFFNLMFIGDATSDFVFYFIFELNFSKTTQYGKV